MKKGSYLLMLSAAILFTIAGCKKDATTTDTDFTSTFSTQTADHAFFSGEDDAVITEVTGAVESDASFSGRPDTVSCGATASVVSNSGGKKMITITYNGINCAGTLTRTGVITLSLPAGAKWKNAGTVLTVTFKNLAITRTSDNKGITLNGTQTITNVSGGNLISLLLTGTSVKHDINSTDMSITFDNGTTRTWSVAKERVYSYSTATGVVLTTTGTHTEGSVSGISEWGTNRLGSDFITQITTPLVISSKCDFRLVSGQIVHTKLDRPITVTFGLNASGNPTTCPGIGNPYYYKVEWTGLQNTPKSFIAAY